MWTLQAVDSMEALGGLPLVGLSAPVLLGIAVLLIFRGSLVPKSVLDDAKKERDEWRAAHGISEAARVDSMKQVDTLLTKGVQNDQTMQRLTDMILTSREGASQ